MRIIDYLSKLEQGKHVFVLDICSSNSMRRRLQDLGLIKETEVSCVQIQSCEV